MPIRLSPFLTRFRAGLAAVAIVGLIVAPAASAADLAAPPTGLPVLHLLNGGYAPGTLGSIDRPGILLWKSPQFLQAFEFETSAVNAVHWPLPASLPQPEGEFCFELAGGDLVYGSLKDFNDKHAVVNSPRLGQVAIERTAIRRIDRLSRGSELIYSGPNGLTGWTEFSPKGEWREESGQPVSDKAGATIFGDFALPARALVELELSWKTNPDFLLALGGGTAKEEKARDTDATRRAMQGANTEPKRTSLDNAFRFEVWDNHLVAHRETEIDADLTPLQEVGDVPGRAQLQVYLDQDNGRMMVFSSSGEPLADLKVAAKTPAPSPNIWLSNLKGDVRLERLRISRWNGDSPREARANLARIHRNDGSIVYGDVSRFDAEANAFVVRDEDGKDSRVPVEQIAAVFLDTSRPAEQRSLRAIYLDGARLSGDLARIEDDALWLKVPGVAEPCRLPIDGLRSLVVLAHETAPTPKPDAEKPGDFTTGRLEMDGLLLPGQLAESSRGSGAGPLVWKPDGSLSAAGLRPNASGKIVYKDPAPPKSASVLAAEAQQRVRVVQAAPVGVAQGFLRALTTASPPQQSGSAGGRRAIHLRTGDIIPSEITRIDEKGVTFKTTISDSTFVANEKVKAVELALSGATVVRLTKTKHERLLTLPRMQKESPPTHLIRAKNGDYLRGRIVGMNDRTLQVEVRLETKDVPRDRISRIIWLHPDETNPPKPEDASKPDAEPKAESRGRSRVQAIRSDGIRLTFVPETFTEGALAGQSDVLGECRVMMKQVDQLLIGTAIEQAAAFTTYGPWRLKNAVQPLVAQDDAEGAGARSPGTESSLVGKDAPDFKLNLLDGTPFKLSEQKGQIVVLDFWATWCGPCLQAMPQIEKVTDEFKDRNVKLIAVNLQEGAEEIKAMLERQKLHPTVALDRDGVVAERYAANAIPQTVIIDKNGKIARLFIGGGPRLGDNLRTALNEVLAAPAEPVKE